MCINDLKRIELGNIIHKHDESIIDKQRDYFCLPDWYFSKNWLEHIEGEPHWCYRKIEKDYDLEEELTKLGLEAAYSDEEEVEKRISDSKDIDVGVFVKWEKINLENLKAFLLPAEKREPDKMRKIQAIRVWTYCLMRTANTIDIESRGCYPANALSNLYQYGFEFEEVKLNSMEGFLQSLKTSDEGLKKEIQLLSGKEAKKAGESLKDCYDGKHLHWQGKTIDRFSDEYQQLLKQVYRSLWEQNEEFRNALHSTKGKRLIHSIGKQNPEETILTENEFVSLLNELRNEIVNNVKTEEN